MKLFYLPLFFAFMVFGCNIDNTAREQKENKVHPNIKSEYNFTDLDTIALSPDSIAKYNIIFRSPETWQHSIDNGLNTRKMPCSEVDVYCANYVLNVVPVTEKKTLYEYSNSFIKIFENRKDINNFTLISSLKERVDNKDAAIIDYKYSMNGVDLGGTTLLLLFSNKLLVINFAALNNPPKSYVRYRGLYERIIKSIRFVK